MDLRSETARVRAELILLRQCYLPRLLPCTSAARAESADLPLVRWQQAVSRLERYLPDEDNVAADAGVAINEDFSPFRSPGTASDPPTTENDRLVWSITSFIPLTLADEQAEQILEWAGCAESHPDTAQTPSWQRVRDNLEQVEEWFLALSPGRGFLLNALCWLVPPLANLDPPFARIALDRDGWRKRAWNNPNLTCPERQKLARSLDRLPFGHVLNNALLHVTAALACNHFAEIEFHLNHPNLVGGYTGLMPVYLFEVLHQKVETLRRLARDG